MDREEKVSRLHRQQFSSDQFLIVLFISCFYCAFNNKFATTLRCTPRVEGIKFFLYSHDFSPFYWNSLHEELNNHYKLDHRSKENPLQAKNSNSDCVRKYTADINILKTSRNIYRKIRRFIRITTGSPTKIRRRTHYMIHRKVHSNTIF